MLYVASYNELEQLHMQVLLKVPAQWKPTMFAPQLNLILLPQPTDTLNGYPSPVYPILSVNWSAFLEGILVTLQSHKFIEQWHQWRVPIR